MAKLKIEFELDNAAFEGNLQSKEIYTILNKLAHIISNSWVDGSEGGKISDSNGNGIGTWSCRGRWDAPHGKGCATCGDRPAPYITTHPDYSPVVLCAACAEMMLNLAPRRRRPRK